MTAVDPVTGLPPLPEGHWWEVRRRRIYGPYYFDSEVIHDGYEVCVMTKYTRQSVTKRGRFWWNARVEVPEEHYEHMVMARHITDHTLVTQRGLRAYNAATRFYQKVGKDVITARDVLDAANEIVVRMREDEARKAGKAASDKMLGAYPPKALRTDQP